MNFQTIEQKAEALIATFLPHVPPEAQAEAAAAAQDLRAAVTEGAQAAAQTAVVVGQAVVAAAPAALSAWISKDVPPEFQGLATLALAKGLPLLEQALKPTA